MGSSAAVPEILSRIAKLLEDEYWQVREAAARAVEKMGPLVAPEFLTRIAELLEDEYWQVREAAVKVVGGMGSSMEPPYTQEMRLEDGVLLCTVCLDEDGREIVEFRTDSDKMEGRSVRCTILKGSEEVGSFLVPLERGYRGILTGRFYLQEKLGEGEAEEVKIRFEPGPPLGGAGEQEGG
jgi:hypothetical protein